MNFKKVIIAADHAGVDLKDELVKFCKRHTISVEDLGATDDVSVDYPDYAHKVCEKVLTSETVAGVLICGSGIGMSMAANRHCGIRAALCLDEDGVTATLARRHNKANILCLGARLMTIDAAINSLQVFLATPFEGGRHERRVQKIETP